MTTITRGEGQLTLRRVDHVQNVIEAGPTDQVDKHNFVLPPMRPDIYDPFLALMEDWFSSVGFEWHPHRGFETVTYVVSGELEHRDNAGGEGLLKAGDVQWVTTGRGVIHSELAHQRQPVHTLQLWLNLPASKKLVEPRYQDLRAAEAPVIRAPGVEVRVFAGTMHGVTGKAQTHWPATVIDGRFEPGGRFVYEVPGEHAAFFYVLAGAVRAGTDGSLVQAGQIAWFAAGSPGPSGIEIVAEQPSHLVAYSAAPVREPVAAYGPFVMNTREEIIQAFEDYQRGKFGPIPA